MRAAVGRVKVGVGLKNEVGLTGEPEPSVMEVREHRFRTLPRGVGGIGHCDVGLLTSRRWRGDWWLFPLRECGHSKCDGKRQKEAASRCTRRGPPSQPSHCLALIHVPGLPLTIL